MKNVLLWMGLCLSTNVMADAQDAAKSALKTKLNSLQNYEASFSQIVIDGQKEVLQESDGKIYLKQPDRLYWEVAEPNETTLIADGKTVWHIDPFVEQVVALDQAQAVENNPLILLTNPSGPDWDKFIVLEKGEMYEIVSNDPNSHISSLTLVFSGSDMVGLRFTDRTEQTSELTFDNIKQNQNIDSTLFDFALPQGYDLDDQR